MREWGREKEGEREREREGGREFTKIKNSITGEVTRAEKSEKE